MGRNQIWKPEWERNSRQRAQPMQKSEGGKSLPCLLGTKHARWTLKPLHMWCPLPGALFLWFLMLRPRFLQEAFLDYHSPFLVWVLPLGSPSRCFSREALGHTSASLTCLPCEGGGQALSTSPNIPCAHMVPAHSRTSRRVCRWNLRAWSCLAQLQIVS